MRPSAYFQALFKTSAYKTNVLSEFKPSLKGTFSLQYQRKNRFFTRNLHWAELSFLTFPVTMGVQVGEMSKVG
jgi:hypothetical protein